MVTAGARCTSGMMSAPHAMALRMVGLTSQPCSRSPCSDHAAQQTALHVYCMGQVHLRHDVGPTRDGLADGGADVPALLPQPMQ